MIYEYGFIYSQSKPWSWLWNDSENYFLSAFFSLSEKFEFIATRKMWFFRCSSNVKLGHWNFFRCEKTPLHWMYFHLSNNWVSLTIIDQHWFNGNRSLAHFWNAASHALRRHLTGTQTVVYLWFIAVSRETKNNARIGFLLFHDMCFSAQTPRHPKNLSGRLRTNKKFWIPTKITQTFTKNSNIWDPLLKIDELYLTYLLTLLIFNFLIFFNSWFF